MKYYKDKSEIEIKVGLIVVISLLIFILGYGWLRDLLSVKKYNILKVRFENANGLEPGDAISVYGVEKGKVLTLDIDKSGIIVMSKIESEIEIPADSKYFIIETDMMGHKQLEIDLGESSELVNFEDTQIGSVKGGISNMVADVTDLIADLSNIIKEIENKNTVSKIDSIITSSNELITNTKLELSKNSLKISNSLSSLNSTLQEIEEFVQENKTPVSKSIAEMDSLFTNFDLVLNETKTLLHRSNNILSEIDESESTIKKLFTERELYDRLNKTTATVDSLIEDIKKNPKKYFTLKIF